MNKHIKWAVLGLSFLLIFIFANKTYATSDNLMISGVQLGDTISASNEFIELKNNKPEDVDITDWCLYYASASNLTNGNKLSCFTPSDIATHLFIPGDMSILFVSNNFNNTYPGVGYDMKFSTSLSGSGGHIRLINDQDVVVDKLGWGTAISPEMSVAAVPGSGRILSRIVGVDDKLQDTDNNLLDFVATIPKQNYQYGNLYEVMDLCLNQPGIQLLVPDNLMIDDFGGCVPVPVDECQNIDGIQVGIPIGMGFDINNDCVIDVCANIDGLQELIPDGLVVSGGDQCYPPDVCLNLDGLQVIIPGGYYADDSTNCWLDLPSLKINEIMPNPAGSDVGNEFIEIYNPNNFAVTLENYELLIGGKYVLFPDNTSIESNGYYVISNKDVSFTLTNTRSSVSLWSLDGIIIDSEVSYLSAPDGESWSYFDSSWAYTNQPTPGLSNLVSYVDPEPITISITSQLKPCAPNQYRNTETNRCRLLTTIGSVLVPCRDGQYRSEITNRCRNISSDAGVLGACDDNQYRSPETNRCRNIVSSVIPAAAFAVEPYSSSSSDSIQWFSFGAIALVAILYAIWEWRPELKKLFSR